MNKKLEKYAELLLKRCLSIKKEQPLFISAPTDALEFVRIVNLVALKLGISDIYYELTDDIIKRDLINNLTKEEMKNNSYFNKKIYDEYAKKGSAFLLLCADNTELMKDIDEEKLGYASKIIRTTKPLYKKMQLKYDIPWCIACVSTDAWARKVLPESYDAKKDLWNLIFKMCLVNKENPIDEWDKKIKNNKNIVDKLNKMNIVSLHYKNKLGTDFEVGFNDNIWCGADTKSTDGRKIIVNMPTEEVFTSPNKYTTNGIVYASLPLVYNGSIVKDFWIEFKDGKVVNYDAKKGKEILKSIIESKNGNYLGEVALVDVTSPISKSKILFYDTLYDENASCHLALGDAFPECIKSTKDLKELGVNESDTHVDFMIGTNDLEITATLKNDKEVVIMKNGKFTI